MNVVQIAWHSILYRRLGSLLTVISMALGVMLVVAVLTVYGLISEFFRNNSSFGYNILLGARGSPLQLVLNSVFYLSKPIETIPYDYYLAFCEQPKREREMRNSIAYRSLEERQRAEGLLAACAQTPGGGWGFAAQVLSADALRQQQLDFMRIGRTGMFAPYVEIAIPILMGDYWVDPRSEDNYRVCATNKDFFEHLVLNLDTDERFRLAAGRFFDDDDAEVGFYGGVVGGIVARRSGLQVGDRIQITHGVPSESSSHLHQQPFVVLGILELTGTPHDRVVFVNMEGFFLIDDHINPLFEQSMAEAAPIPGLILGPRPRPGETEALNLRDPELLNRIPLPMEHRELTAVLIKAGAGDQEGADPFAGDLFAYAMPKQIEQAGMESLRRWSPFNPVRAQTSVQAVNPVIEVTALLSTIDPARWLLLGLTFMICIVSGVSILVGMYNSMTQRRHEIAVMRALGARRSQVMSIVLVESLLLAVAGGMLGWIAGHVLNAALSPLIESYAGIRIGLFDFAPAEPIFYWLPGNIFPANLVQFQVSPELLVIPALMALAVVVGTFPAISAYRTDVSQSLGK
ncbi:MAG TPA: ABC transporter permease [Pirellulaceae bacterium]|nr:ABC transporter permease [Pirellulaceae bacterium]